MIHKKVSERFAYKRFVSRLLILAAIVVFGAIAIVHAQKGESPLSNDATNEASDDVPKNTEPIEDAQHQSVSLASFEEPLDDSLDHAHVETDEPTESPPALAEVPHQEDFKGQIREISDQTDLTMPDLLDDDSNYQDDLQPIGAQAQAEDDPLEAIELLSSQEEDRIHSDGNFNGQNPYRESIDDPPGGTEPLDIPPLDDFEQEENVEEQPFADDNFSSSDLDEPFSSENEPNDANDSDGSANPDLGVDEGVFSNGGRNSIQEHDRESNLEIDSEAFPHSDQPNSNFTTDYDLADRNAPLRATGRPGPQNLEGPQTPTLTIEKKAPPEIQVGQPTKFKIRVRNNGQAPADNVVIRDEIPEGTKLIDSTPEAVASSDGALLWEVGTINPGEESTVTVQLMPEAEGQIGSVATVSFQASATARARATRPQLALEHSCPRQIMLGETVKFTIKLSNPGSGTAQQVVLDENVPPGLKHSSGPKLEYEVGAIRPGQTRHLELTLTADEPGRVVNTLVARGQGGLLVKDTFEMEVISPRLQVGVTGPTRRYLEREATFTVSVANPGTAAARHVELITMLPRGLKFLSTNNSGHYDQARHAVIWSLETLPAGEMGKAQFKALPTEMGQYLVKAEAQAERNLKANQEHNLLVEGIAALYFGIVDEDPIEIGGKTTYVLTVENQGSKAATNVKFIAELPVGMKPLNGDRGTIRGQRIFFEPIRRLAPKAKTKFRIVVQGVTAGDHKIRVQMTGDDISAPVIKEESTRVYSD